MMATDDEGTPMPSTPRANTALPEFTAAQTWVLEVVAEKAADKAVEKFSAQPCTLSCPRMEAVEGVTFGNAEHGVRGLDDRLMTAEKTLANLIRLMWLAVGMLFTLAGSLIFYISTH